MLLNSTNQLKKYGDFRTACKSKVPVVGRSFKILFKFLFAKSATEPSFEKVTSGYEYL